MIRICYENFATGTHDVTGLHGRAEHRPRGATLYLLPGLTTGERRAVIRRLRQEASRGFGPPLPQPQLAIALGLDRVRTAARVAAAAVRLHPAVTLLPGAAMVAVMALFVISSAGVQGSALKARTALAAAGPVLGGGNSQAVGARLDPARMASARVTEVTVKVKTGAGRTRPHAATAARAVVWRGTWYACPRAVTGLSAHRSCQG